METTSEQHRIAFSKRLTQELKRIGQPIGSPTQIARTFNQNFSGKPVSAQTVRKWLLVEAVPTQPKLLALAAWLGVSAQWLRFLGVWKENDAIPALIWGATVGALLLDWLADKHMHFGCKTLPRSPEMRSGL